MIHSKDISVIVQGGVNEHTKECLISVRENFPESQIILSTWRGSDVKGLEYDEIVFSNDPGGTIIDDKSGSINNVNRQIVSTKAGIDVANRRYYLKTRTDIMWTNSNFLEYFSVYDVKHQALHFRNRLLVCNYYTRNPRVLPIPFHISDWIIFGISSDVKLFYDNVECQEIDEMRWFENHRKINHNFYTNLLVRFVPEQHILMSFLNKFYDLNCSCFYDNSIENIELTEKIIAMDFVVLDYKKQMGIIFPKYNPNKYLEKFTLISHRHWKKLYREYCEDVVGIHKRIRLVRDNIFYVVFLIRKVIVDVLHKLRVKEKVKRILERISAR